jgi:hypothetical protein
MLGPSPIHPPVENKSEDSWIASASSQTASSRTIHYLMPLTPPTRTMRTMRSNSVCGGHSLSPTATMSPTTQPTAAQSSPTATMSPTTQPTAAQSSIAKRLVRKRPAAWPASEDPQQSTRGPVPRNEREEPEDLCPICLCELGSDFGTTHCGHSFHADCLSTWMIQDRRHTCPECRAYVGASASRSRMFAAAGESHNVPVLRPARMPRFHGG